MRLRQPQGEGWRGKEGRGVGRWRMGEQKAGKGETGSGPEESLVQAPEEAGRLSCVGLAGLCGRSVRVRKSQGHAL